MTLELEDKKNQRERKYYVRMIAWGPGIFISSKAERLLWKFSCLLRRKLEYIYIYLYLSIRELSFSDYGENYKTVNRLVPSPLYLDCTRRTEREKRV